MIPHYYNSKLYITIFTYPKWFSFTGCKNWRDNFVFSKISKTIKCYLRELCIGEVQTKQRCLRRKMTQLKLKSKIFFILIILLMEFWNKIKLNLKTWTFKCPFSQNVKKGETIRIARFPWAKWVDHSSNKDGIKKIKINVDNCHKNSHQILYTYCSLYELIWYTVLNLVFGRWVDVFFKNIYHTYCVVKKNKSEMNVNNHVLFVHLKDRLSLRLPDIFDHIGFAITYWVKRMGHSLCSELFGTCLAPTWQFGKVRISLSNK